VIDAAGNRIDYAYDDAGNKTGQTVTPFGAAPMVTGYGYDVLNRLATVTDVNGLVTTYTYDENGNRASVTYPNGNETTYVYDANNRLTRQATENGASVLLADYQYTLDPSGHRLRIDEPGRQTTYTYDDSYKLLTEAIVDPVNGDHSSVYEYDKVGNRTYSTINGVQTLYAYDANDRLLQQGGEVFTYDANGNTLTKTIDGLQSSYTYDAKNHLAGGLLNDAEVITSTSYRYDVDGIRTGKTEGADSVDYLVDHNRDYAQVVRETDGGGAIVDYLYGDDLIKQSQTAANERYYLYDGLGSTRLLTDSAGAITDSYDYEAFGSIISQSGITENNYRFTGEQYDTALNQYYLRARYYDPDFARFTQMDTWKGMNLDPLSLQKYLYIGSDPINHVDPSGHFFSLSEVAATLNIRSSLSGIQVDVGTSLLDVALDPGSAERGFTQNSGLLIGLSVLGPSGAKILKTLSNKALKRCKNRKETCYRALLGRVNTPHGVAEQLDSPAAWAALKKAQEGAPLYKIGKIGRSEVVESQFWSLVDPRKMGQQDFAKAFGIPKANADFDFIVTGTLRPGAHAITRVAPPAGGNPGGGAIELVTNPNSVFISFEPL